MKPNETPKLNCEITRDLLPLYVEQLTAPGTAAAVKAHLDACPECAARHARMAAPEPMPPAAAAAREVVYLRSLGQLSFREIGDVLGKTENWARVTFYRGKEKLRGGTEHGN